MSIEYVVSVAVAGDKAIAGPLVVAALILDARINAPRFSWPSSGGRRTTTVDDFDSLPEQRRPQISDALRARAAGYSVLVCSPHQLNEDPSRQLRTNTMGRALVRAVEHAMYRNPRFRLHIDRTRILASSVDPIPVQYVGNGKQELHRGKETHPWQLDAAYAVARAHRDVWMYEAATEHPAFDFEVNYGYASPPHRRALETLGPTRYHRRRSSLVREISGSKLEAP